VGFFIDNELAFAGNPVQPARRIFRSARACHSRLAMLRFLQRRYPSIHALNTAWEQRYDDWDGLRGEAPTENKACAKDMLDFGVVYLRGYYQVCRDAMREAAPNKLYLGSRIHTHQNQRLLEICARYADVVSVNCYDYTPDILELPRELNKPVLIGEYHFGTVTERGVWGGGLCTAADIRGAAALFSGYPRAALRHPLIVGAHYFQISDQPLTGRGDGENYRIGFVDITDSPYPEMVSAARAVGDGMYPLRAGTRAEPKPEAGEGPQ
jgi:hypothetical protein